MKQPAVYIVTNRLRGVLYVGVTSDLIKRIWEHKNNLGDGFTKKYKLHTLVYYELCAEMLVAIEREKILKKWTRDWKVQLIETTRTITVVEEFTQASQLAGRLTELAEAHRAKARERRYLQAFRERHYNLLRRLAELKKKLTE